MGWPYALALLVVGLLLGQVWARRSRRLWGKGTARPALALGAIAALVGSLVLAVRGAWLDAVLLLGLAAALTGMSRRRAFSPKPASATATMSRGQAAALLGLRVDASEEEVQAAYRRLMRAVHPDQGGTEALAAQLNAARDVLMQAGRR